MEVRAFHPAIQHRISYPPEKTTLDKASNATASRQVLEVHTYIHTCLHTCIPTYIKKHCVFSWKQTPEFQTGRVEVCKGKEKATIDMMNQDSFLCFFFSE
ncbi:uncharacterized protein BO97DRAFT_31013 [Aspergillus homomorphus CBS 101889]|uniref:Uncharacterized protein n=1 Tax=Aspergillus homomorphus (strain CBS 101889) TaxID=1450537 RepID=A0A395I2Y3_ASPHC|nr:hypothetical protein BO97DRAFT_31013 [Aspergillus homomorphus CBS 101889]RAL13548.1 hypothetical protein BO97DRAFT_31013 [Aspergillus homomorphus CBS 101889]